MNNYEILKFYENKENLISDFNDFLKENDYELMFDSLVNDFYINEFLEQTFFNIENLDTTMYFAILDDYCCQLPF